MKINYKNIFKNCRKRKIVVIGDLILDRYIYGNVAIGLKKRIVLLNNIFNRNEFELYGLGEIIEPNVDCLGCYKSSCEEECMRRISPDTVLEVCERLLSKNTHG